MRNPFRPTAGATPPEVIGRTGLLDVFDQALGRSSGAHGRRMIITGARGIGKTVMLGVAQDLARGHGWEVISETATVGLAGRLGVSVRRLAEERFGVSVGGAWQDVSADLLRRLREAGSGLFITVDEIHAVGHEDLVQIGAAFQDFTHENLPVALVVAGLPAEVSNLLGSEPAAFLRQADQIVLRNVTVTDAEASLGKTFRAGGFEAPAGAFRRAAEATDGYPFLVQLVGYFLWQEAEGGDGLTATSLARAIERAHRWNAHTIL